MEIMLKHVQLSALALSLLKMNSEAYEYEEVIIDPDSTYEPKRARAIVHESASELLRVFPNPAYSQVIISYDMSDKDYRMLKAEIYNIQGKIVMEMILDVKALQARIDLHHLSPGKYLVRLVGDGRVLGTEKLSIGR